MQNCFELDKEYLEKIEHKFNIKKDIAKNRYNELFSVFNDNLTSEEEFLLKFLYAYMPLNDMADYSGEFFLKHIRNILNIKSKVSWGNKISGSDFLHFVLPYRINNENIENFTEVMFKELYPRIKDLSMYDAICEVNHWCHEKATYISTDIRTASPLTVIRTAFGRCGEESTLLVAALRSLCIPSRQCYTPRWAHCDSNHAWVEAWADGIWYFLGACEPEPRLNMGWFTAPSRRAMLVNTRIAGNYTGAEEITLSHEWYTEINLLRNYAPCKNIKVKIKDENGKFVTGAQVRFEIFNSGEFWPIVRLTTNDKGEVSLTTGYGDILIHAHKDGVFGFQKISVKDNDVFEVIISQKSVAEGTLEFKMIPPPEIKDNETSITEEEQKRNTLMLKEEDDIRKAFENTFISQKESDEQAYNLGLPKDRLWKILKMSRGNSHEILKFIKEQTPKYGEWPLKLLESLKEKDLTDTFIPVLTDHLIYSLPLKGNHEDEVFTKYIMCPRVNYEMIGAYKHFFQSRFSKHEIDEFRKEPKLLVNFIKKNIEILDGYNYYVGYSTPRGTFELKKCDSPSVDILYVAMARSFGIPARLRMGDKKPQYLKNGEWIDVNLREDKVLKQNRAVSKIRFNFDDSAQKPVYFGNFSIAKLNNGIFTSLDFEDIDINLFKEGVDLEEGEYRLTTATRLSDGTVLVRFTFIKIKGNETLNIDVKFLSEETENKFYGILPIDFKVKTLNNENLNAVDSLKDNGIVLAFIEPDREPTKHLLRELKEFSKEFNEKGNRIFLIIAEDKYTSAFDDKELSNLPDNVIFCIDINNDALKEIKKATNNDIPEKYPIVYVSDKEGNLIYQSIGYKLGIASDIIKIINK
ncbi:Transglutaminase-like superfamily protein [Caloramator quimbayensis]|uniref:Transglutaminase-like superfamily protein n=1 Tax=Caloramator quimbayensis TaxID=1147123 RepID=A0A1T4WG13_9CLOT|nr:transglutaminase-like domain-containing protein [Caloramator quimbayensis]SKA76099.1 Transglutaminase-like superfamily protein [Caloramator quimbayensis]